MAYNALRGGPTEESWTLVDEQRRLRAIFRQAAPGANQLATSEVDSLAIKARRGSGEAAAHLLGLLGDFIVQSATKWWHSASKPSALSVDQLGDLVQAGVEGLRIAVKGFRVESGKSFQNYASVVISRAIRSSAHDGRRSVVIPRHVRLQLAKYGKAERELGQILGRDPSRAEVADRMQCSMEAVEAMETLSAERRVPVDALEGEFTVKEFRREGKREREARLSPNPLSEDDILRIGNLIPSPLEELELRCHWERIRALRAALQTLDERPKTIVVEHWGLDGEAPRSFSKIAPRLRMTRQRAQQVHAAGLVTLHDILAPLPPFQGISTLSNGETHGKTSARTSKHAR
jgi:RNA polymerase sigma factor (sigma-70 family)